MSSFRFKSVLVAMALVLLLSGGIIAGENDKLLDSLKNSNDRFESIINKRKISYSMLTNANPLSPKQGLVLKQCEASWKGDMLSMHIVCSYETPPAYSPSEQRIDYDKDGTLIIWRPVERYIQFSPTRNEVLQKSKRFYAYPDGSIKEGNETTFHLIYSIGKTDIISEYRHFELATGRGISKELENISSIEQDTSRENVKIKAKGSWSKGFEGWWILSVEPNSDYLIREAAFSVDVNSPPILRVSSSGIVSTKDGVTFASKGTLIFDKNFQTSIDDVNIVQMSDKECADFHQKISEQLDMPMNPGTQVWDFRGEKPVKYTVK